MKNSKCTYMLSCPGYRCIVNISDYKCDIKKHFKGLINFDTYSELHKPFINAHAW